MTEKNDHREGAIKRVRKGTLRHRCLSRGRSQNHKRPVSMETGPAPCKLLGMTRKQLQLWLGAAAFLCPPGGLLLTLLSPVVAQDIRGLELCTAETRMERRTGCLQANIEFLQQALIKLARETRDKITAADRDIAVARAEIASLKATTEKLNSELAQMKANAQPNDKK